MRIPRALTSAPALTLAACASMIASAYAFRPLSPSYWLEEAAGLMLLGIIFMGAALWRHKIVLPLPAADSQAEKFERRHLIILVAGVFALALLATINGIPPETSAGVSTHLQFLLLCVGVTLVVLGFGLIRFSMPRIDWWVVLLLAAIMLLALILRIWQLNTTIRFLVDELAFSTAILNLRANPNLEILLPMEGTAAFPFVFAYWQSLGVELLGRNFAGLRVASAIIGTLTIPALFWLANALFDRKTAFLAAFLLAVFPPHLQFSRIGLNNIADPLFGTWALAFLAHGLKTGRRVDYILGGAMLGLTQYFYELGRIFYIPLVLVWFAAMVMISRPRARTIPLTGLVSIIVAMPVYYTLLARSFGLAARVATPNIMLDGDYWRKLLASGDFAQHLRYHVLDPFLIYVHQPDRTFYYGGQTPLVLDYLVPALLLGAAFALWRWRTPGGALLILWVVSLSLANSFLAQSVMTARYVVVFPALVLLCAVGIRYTLALVLPEKTRAQIILMSVLAVIFGIAQVNYYFEWHLPLYNFSSRAALPHRDGQDAVLRSLNFPPGTQVHILSDAPPNSHYTGGLLAFLAGDTVSMDILTMADFTDEYIDNMRTDVDHAFFLDWETGGLNLLLRDKFDMQPPLYSPFDISTSQQYILYYARHREQDAP